MYKDPKEKTLFETEEEYEEYYGGYDYSFDSGLAKKGGDYFDNYYDEEDGKKSNSSKDFLEREKAWWEKESERYEKTGVWKGYYSYKKQTLDYEYVEKIANMLSAKYDIKVQVGSVWGINLDEKILTYNPTSLIYGTKSELLMVLLHEIGHLRYSVSNKYLNSNYLKMYPGPASFVLNLYEDFRVDDRMAKSYPSAEEIYQARGPVIEKLAEKYRAASKTYKDGVTKLLMTFAQYGHIGTDEEVKEIFGTTNLEEIKEKERRLKDFIDNNFGDKENLLDYCSLIILRGYGKEMKAHTVEMEEFVSKTEKVVPEYVKQKLERDGLKVLDQKVYPVIEDLLKQSKGMFNELEQIFSTKSGQHNSTFSRIKESIERLFDETVARVEGVLPHQLYSNGAEKGFEIRVRGSSFSVSGSNIPDEWRKGEYEPIKSSVNSSIKELVRKLSFIRIKDLTQKFAGNQRRGTLRTASLYKFKLGNTRLFQRKEEVVDRIKSFAFSILIDCSGSMSGARIMHATRGAILLSEVFSQMQIPFEVAIFDTQYKELKAFATPYDKSSKLNLAGMPLVRGGGTNILPALSHSKIADRKEKSKIMIILSDGDVSYIQDVKSKIRNLNDKKKVRTIGFGIGGSNRITEMCEGGGIPIDHPAEIPTEFTKLLKKLVGK